MLRNTICDFLYGFNIHLVFTDFLLKSTWKMFRRNFGSPQGNLQTHFPVIIVPFAAFSHSEPPHSRVKNNCKTPSFIGNPIGIPAMKDKWRVILDLRHNNLRFSKKQLNSHTYTRKCPFGGFWGLKIKIRQGGIEPPTSTL